MSNYETKPGQGAIFKNNKKEKETQPDYRGTFVDIDGGEREISLWVKESKNGTKYFSVSVQKPYNSGNSQQGTNNKPESQEPEDDLPF